MSTKSREKLLDRFQIEYDLKVKGEQKRKAILVTDSKGRYLRNEVDKDEENLITFCFRLGASFDDKILIADLKAFLEEETTPLVFIWLGTCQFTEKRGVFIYLRKNFTVRDAMLRCEALKREIIDSHPTAEIIFLRSSPFFPIFEWNDCHGHRNPDTSDDILFEVLKEFN